MQETLSYFIFDDAHEVPSLILLVGETEERARQLATEDLRDNPRHVAIEVRVDDTLLFTVQRDAAPIWQTPEWDPEAT